MTNVRDSADERVRPAYLDCAATTPILDAALEEMQFFLRREYGNSGSRTHEFGAAAKRRVTQARTEIAAVVEAESDEVVFTSGATESNNIAILGLRDALVGSGRTHIVCSRLEHKAVLEPVQRLEQDGFTVTWLDTDESGVVSVTAVRNAVTDETGLVCLMQVNNETGVIQPVDEIAGCLHGHPAYFFVDAAQGFGKQLDSLRNSRVDLISASAHKVHGPKGVGALIARRREFERPPIRPLVVGGGQERGVRAGTLPVHLLAGFGTAARLALAENAERSAKNQAFRERLLTALAPLAPVVNGEESRLLPQILNVTFPGADAEAVIVATKDLIAVSNGSACTSSRYEPSHVLVAMGLDDQRIAGAIRLSWCHLSVDPDWIEVVGRVSQLQSPTVAVTAS